MSTLLEFQLRECVGPYPQAYPDQLIRQFPRIADRVATLWGKAELDDYFDALLIDSRGDRKGFPTLIGRELIVLSLIYDLVRSRPLPQPPAIWGLSSRRD
ncbi:hypothetical protein [Jeongeupia naejangsanensis]|uniref:Transposase InsH N-terminal domain-containing protein n=1 Tax=Jeongeupia naejangsanensis TaxID=613195 RepID=A0ABS2BNR3_9NEIS|nr:hypothetical protein [Jeongeupia naejangsanensis]MBM3117271.1 hypothetical protein [Jeongeupia naejangsanensis]